MLEKILVIFLFIPIAIYTTIQYSIIHFDKEKNLIPSGQKIENIGEWSKAKEMISTRYEFGGARVKDKIYIIGGLFLPTVYAATGRNEVYDMKTDTWKEVSFLPVIVHHPGVTSDGDYLYVVGGDGFKITPYNSLYRYDPTMDKWEKLNDMPTKRGALAVVYYKGKIYAVGGAEYMLRHNNLEVYDIAKKTWEKKKPMPTAREHLSAAVADGKIYVMGGYTIDRYNSLNTVEIYDIKTDTWKTGKPLPLKINGFTATAFQNNIFVFGGQQGAAVSGEVHEYDTKSDTWHRLKDLPFPRSALVAIPTDKNIHLIGGNKVVGGYQYIRDHEIFTPSKQ